ncbi:MAG: tRNA lysidine(34) synthetase TilS [Paludibacteraceae bacterium]|nr:tRNA lysidine(34) synthetase TilS [Paludibacteraceae bacterium]
MKLILPEECTKETPLLVCVSGGGDSVCLLLALHEQGYKCLAAHCNFHLRGKESDKDEEFVTLLADRLHVPLVKKDFDTEAYAEEKHLSIEMAARELRYGWFEEERVRLGCQYIAVAHNLNDSVETFFLNLTRGTGIKGLTGIRPKNSRVIRPLLNITRDEIEDYLIIHKQNFRTDSTNSDTKYRRNRIRHNILPEFVAMNPSFLETMRDTMENLAVIQASLDDPSSPEKRLYELYKQLSQLGFTHDRIRQVWKAEQTEASGKVFENGQVKVVVDRGKTLIYKKRETKELCFTVTNVDNQGASLKSGADFAFFDEDKLVLPLNIRRWKAGDWFVPYGMKGRKKISDYLTERKLDVVQKESQQLLVDASGNVVWVIGQRTDNRFSVDNKTVRVVKVEVSEKC